MEIEIVVPVHTFDRPIRRAVKSVLAEPKAGVVVVAHGLEGDQLDLPEDPRIKVVQVDEGMGEPGVAFNRGLAAATAPWVGIMGSDDWFEPGSLATMLERAKHDQADGVVAPLRHAAAGFNSVKPATWRRRGLKGARDQLFYRTAPLGLFRRGVLAKPRYRFEEEVSAGVDQISSVLLWTDGNRISYYPQDPAYVVGDDAASRVTTVKKPLREHAAAWVRVWDHPAVKALPRKDRRALAEKMLNVHVFGFIAANTNGQMSRSDFEWLSQLARRFDSEVPHFREGLTKSARATFEALAAGEMEETLARWSGATYVGNRLPSSWRTLVNPNYWVLRQPIAWAGQLRERLAGHLNKGNR